MHHWFSGGGGGDTPQILSIENTSNDNDPKLYDFNHLCVTSILEIDPLPNYYYFFSHPFI